MLDPISLLGARVIAYRPILRACGVAATISGALLASQLLYLYDRAGRQEFHTTDAQLAESVGMTVDEVRGARADLVKRLGPQAFFGYEVRGMKREAFWTVREDRFAALMRESLPDPSGGPDSPDDADGSGQPVPQGQIPPEPSVDADSGAGPNASGLSAGSIRATARFHSGAGPNHLYTRSSIEEIKKEDPPISPRDAGGGSRVAPFDALAKPAQQPAGCESTTQPPSPMASATAISPDPGTSTAGRSKRDPLAGRELPRGAVPPDLAHLARHLADWWAVKNRGRTTRAFELACGLLRRYSPADQARMLEAATIGGWQGLHEVTPSRAAMTPGSFQRSARPTRTEEAVANVCAMAAALEAKAAARSAAVTVDAFVC